MIWFDELAHLEQVLGYGGQLGSFEAVFSPRDASGQPERLWDRRTGEINPDVAQHWKKFDIRFVLENNWDELSRTLQGKIHIHVDQQETFYLDGAVERLKETLMSKHPGLRFAARTRRTPLFAASANDRIRIVSGQCRR